MIIRRVHYIIFWLGLSLYLGSYIGWQSWVFQTQDSDQAESPLVITEIMASNGGDLTDEDGDLTDWIEVFNRGSEPIDLTTWTLTDDPTQPDKWQFPTRSLSPQSYLVVFASGKNRRPSTTDQNLHTNFKLEKNGGYLAIINHDQPKSGEMFALNVPQQWRYIAYGQYDDSQTFAYSPQATPGQPNTVDIIWATALPEVQFSHPRGFYDAPFELSLLGLDPEATIRFTLDGSQPSETHGQLYEQPLPITKTSIIRAALFRPGHLTARITTQTYLFIDDVIDQPTMPPHWPQTANEIGEMEEALLALPTMSLVSDDDSFYIYAHAWQKGREWETPGLHRANSVAIRDTNRTRVSGEWRNAHERQGRALAK